jgi:nucleoside-diphosphate-sugar epimerase
MIKSNVLIFGAGEISNLLIKELIFRGNKVLCVSNNTFGQIDNLLNENLKIFSYEEILNQKLEIDATIFAWKDSSRLISDNYAILNWIESRNFHTNKSFHLSSSSVYKDFKSPQNENCKILEENKKLELENLLTEIAVKKDSSHTNLRISNVYGIDISYGFIGLLLSSIKHDSEVSIFKNLSITRDYIHVHDVIYAIRMMLEVDTDLACLNISTGIGTTISQVLEIFASKGYNFEKRREIADNLRAKQVSILDCKRLSKLINWQPRTLTEVLSDLLPFKLYKLD